MRWATRGRRHAPARPRRAGQGEIRWFHWGACGECGKVWAWDGGEGCIEDEENGGEKTVARRRTV